MTVETPWLCSGHGLLLASQVLVEDVLGGFEGLVSWDGYVSWDAGSLPGWPVGRVGVDGGDA